jgi:hypothetical protein
VIRMGQQETSPHFGKFNKLDLEYVLPSLIYMGGRGGLVASESCSWGESSACKLTLRGRKEDQMGQTRQDDALDELEI